MVPTFVDGGGGNRASASGGRTHQICPSLGAEWGRSFPARLVSRGAPACCWSPRRRAAGSFSSGQGYLHWDWGWRIRAPPCGRTDVRQGRKQLRGEEMRGLTIDRASIAGPGLLVAAVLLLTGCGTGASAGSATMPESAAVRQGTESITVERIRGHLEVLAHDSLGGRDTPSQGLESAAAYLATELRRFGLGPAGTNQTFYQRYPFVRRGAPSDAAPAFPPNVVAVWPGSDPALKDEYVVLTAHFDHVGIGRPVDGDSIYNGADDNASGTAALLEVARAFASLDERPKRSVLFLFVSGEEHGLLGSRWYSDNPTVPIGSIVANINADMIGRNAPDSIVVIGKEYSSLGEIVDGVGHRHPELGLVVSDDLWPEERFFYRSDHFNFARQEIPILFFFSGVHEDYHRPSDTLDRIDADKITRVARLIFHTTFKVANASDRPHWDAARLEEVRGMTRRIR